MWPSCEYQDGEDDEMTCILCQEKMKAKANTAS